MSFGTDERDWSAALKAVECAMSTWGSASQRLSIKGMFSVMPGPEPTTAVAPIQASSLNSPMWLGWPQRASCLGLPSTGSKKCIAPHLI